MVRLGESFDRESHVISEKQDKQYEFGEL